MINKATLLSIPTRAKVTTSGIQAEIVAAMAFEAHDLTRRNSLLRQILHIDAMSVVLTDAQALGSRVEQICKVFLVDLAEADFALECGAASLSSANIPLILPCNCTADANHASLIMRFTTSRVACK